MSLTMKYLCVYRINCSIKELSTKKIMKTNHVKMQILSILNKKIAYLQNKLRISKNQLKKKCFSKISADLRSQFKQKSCISKNQQ